MLGLIGQVGITNRRENRVVTENLLDLDEVDAGLDQVSGIAMSKTVGGDLFFRPQVSMTRLSARCTPSRSSAEVALAAALKPP